MAAAAQPDPIRYHDFEVSKHAASLPNIPYHQVERLLMIAAISCAIISLVPNLSLAGAIPLRAISCTMGGIKVMHSLKEPNARANRLHAITSLAAVAIGLVGVAAQLNLLVGASIVLDTALQVIQAGQGAEQKDLYKALTHVSSVLVNSFTIAALLTGGWGYMVAGAALSSAVMFQFGTKAIVDAVRHRDLGAAFDAVCYFALGGIAIAGAVRSAKIVHNKTTRYFYTYYNKHNQPVTFYDKHHRVVAVVQPGKAISFAVDPKDTRNVVFNKGYITVREPCSGEIHDHILRYSIRETAKTIVQSPMTAAEFPTLPVGSSAVPTQDPLLEKREVPTDRIESAELERFLKPIPFEPILITDEKIALIHQATGREYAVPKNGSTVLNECPGKIYLRVEEALFERLAEFLVSGRIDLSSLKEDELLALYNAADDLKITRLHDHCQREVGIRLKNLKWERIELFEPYSLYPRPITDLLKLFSFEKKIFLS